MSGAEASAAAFFGLIGALTLIVILAVGALVEWVDSELDELERFAEDVSNGTLDR